MPQSAEPRSLRRWLPVRRSRGTRTTKSLPAVLFLEAYVVLLIGVPSTLIFEPLGAPGTPANMVGLGALLWWAAAKVDGHLAWRPRSPVRISLGLLMLSVVVSYGVGSLRGWYAPSGMRQRTDDVWTLAHPSIDQVTTAMTTAADRGLLVFFAWSGITLLTIDGLRSWADVDRLVRGLCWTITAFAAVGIFQFYTGTNLASYISIPGLTPNSDVGISLTRSVLNRVSSTSGHPIEFGVVAAAVFPLALHLAIFRRSRRDLVPAFVIGVAIPLAVSRSGILTLVLGLVVLFAYWPAAWRRKALWIAPVAIVAMRLAIPGLVGTIFSLFRGIATDPSITGRTADYGVVLELYALHPWFGRGLFTFVPRYYRILDNHFLLVLVELGAIGLLALVVLMLSTVGVALGARKRCADRRESHLSLAVAAGLVGLFVTYLTFDAWGYAQAAGLSFLLVGLAGAVGRLSHGERRTHGVPAAVRRVREVAR